MARVSLFKSTTIVSMMTLFSRGLGFVRDTLMAVLFGATAGFDAFLVAFKIPNFMRALFAEGSFAQAFVPVLTTYQLSHSQKEIKLFLSHILGWLVGTLLLLTVLCEILSPLIVLLFAPGFVHDPFRYQVALHMLRIILPYILLISVTALWGALLNSYGHFFAPSFAPVLLNLMLIAAAICLPHYFAIPEEALAWAVLVAGLLQFCFQLPFLIRYNLLSLPKWRSKDPQVRLVLRSLIPALFGVSVVQMGLLIDTLFASFLVKGSISWLYYADRLTFFPLGVFGVALATVVLPHLSTLFANNQHQDFTKTLDWALRVLLLISFPAMIGLACISGPLTVTLFKHGQFNSQDVWMTQKSIQAFSIGLPAFMAVKILAAAFYARQEVKRPARFALYATAINIIVNVTLIVPMAHIGLALATSISAITNGLLLFLALRQQGIYKPLPGWRKFILQLLFANIALASLLLSGVPKTKLWLTWSWHSQIMSLLVWLAIAVLFYFVCLWASGVRVKEFLLKTSSTLSKEIIFQ